MTKTEAQDLVLRAAEALAAEPDRWISGSFVGRVDGKVCYCVLGMAAMLKFGDQRFTSKDIEDLGTKIRGVLGEYPHEGWAAATASNEKRPDATFVPRIRKALGL